MWGRKNGEGTEREPKAEVVEEASKRRAIQANP